MNPTTETPAQATGNGPGGYGPPGGGPPRGGFGGPPNPYGGPPPGGGGFGGPPGGFGGPPGGGFGGPPNPYGGPPLVPQPVKSGPNWGLILGLGCGALFLLALLGVGVALFVFRRAASVPPPSIAGPSKGVSAPAGGGSTGTLKAELRDLRDFKGEYGKSRYFVGELYNTGTEALGFPSAKVVFYDAANTAVDSGICASMVRVLPPGEKIPCFFSIFKAETYASSKVEVTPMRSFYTGPIADLKVSDVKFLPKAGYNPNTVEGKITNLSGFKAKTVWALVSLYGADGKIVGAEQALVVGNDLDAGRSGLFSAKVYNVAAKPETYNVKAVGYGD